VDPEEQRRDEAMREAEEEERLDLLREQGGR
jgi:hypothetical protein